MAFARSWSQAVTSPCSSERGSAGTSGAGASRREKGAGLRCGMEGCLRCWGRALHLAPFLVASPPAVPRPSTAGDGGAVGMQCVTRHCSSACHRLRALSPLFRALGAPWHCRVHLGLSLCPAPPARWFLGPGSAVQSQHSGTTVGSRCCHAWLKPQGATPSDTVAGRAGTQGGWIGGWGCVGNTCTLLMPEQGYPQVGRARLGPPEPGRVSVCRGRVMLGV